MFNKILIIGAMLVLTACNSTPVTHNAIYVQPATPGGRMCTNQCSESRNYCMESCDLDNRACYNQVQMQAEHDYDAYARERFAAHAPIDLFPSDFEHPQSCINAKKSCANDCERPYDSCYQNCGGSVSVTSSCQFMCFE